MNKTEFKQAYEIFRANGNMGIKFIRSLLGNKIADAFENYYFNVFCSKDKLKEREDIIHYCVRENLEYNFHQLRLS